MTLGGESHDIYIVLGYLECNAEKIIILSLVVTTMCCATRSPHVHVHSAIMVYPCRAIEIEL